MIRYNQDAFLQEIFSSTDTVEVNAVELQRLIKSQSNEILKNKSEINRLNNLLALLTEISQKKEKELKAMKLKESIVYKLDLSA